LVHARTLFCEDIQTISEIRDQNEVKVIRHRGHREHREKQEKKEEKQKRKKKEDSTRHREADPREKHRAREHTFRKSFAG
jgi:hypothetical protein